MAEFISSFSWRAAALGAALGVVLGRNPVHAALLLVTVLISIAVMFLLQDAQLLAAVQIIVYAGAIVVLFLFVIMLLGIDRHESLHDPVRSIGPPHRARRASACSRCCSSPAGSGSPARPRARA